MKVITKKEAMRMGKASSAEPITFDVPQKLWFFVDKAMVHHVMGKPMQTALNVGFLLAALYIGFSASAWMAFAILLAAFAVLQLALAASYAKLHKMLTTHRCRYRADPNGITLMAEGCGGEGARTTTYGWNLVRSIYTYGDFIAVKMDRAVQGPREHFLASGDVLAARKTLAANWRAALEATGH